MLNVNRVTLLGTVTQEPEVHETKNGLLTVLGLTTVRTRKDAAGNTHSESASHRLVCTGELATFVAKRVREGAAIYAEGCLRHSPEDTTIGQVEILVDRIVLLSATKRGESVSETSDA